MSQLLERPRSERHANVAGVWRGFRRPRTSRGVQSFTESLVNGALSANCVNVRATYGKSEDAPPSKHQQSRSGASPR
jgi:hypothetical protein